MSDLEYPYNSPEAPIIPEKTPSAGNLTETMMRYLKESSPWLRFIGILGFIGCGLLVLWAIIAVIGTIATTAFLNELINFPIWIISPIYFIFAAVLFFPSLYTYNFGAMIRKYSFSNSDDDLEQALKNNKSLWKFYGIMCIIYLAIIPVIFVIAIIIGVAATTGIF